MLAQLKTNHLRKINCFHRILDFSKAVPVSLQQLTEQQLFFIKPNYLTEKRKHCQQLAQILEQKQQEETRAQQQFLRTITQQYQKDKTKELYAVIDLQRILNRKISNKLQQSFKKIQKILSPQQSNFKLIKNVLINSFSIISQKIKQNQNHALKQFLIKAKLESINDKIISNLKRKGNALIQLKNYSKPNLKKYFWIWYLRTTQSGKRIFLNLSQKVVLYTKINKFTFFYRLYNQVKRNHSQVDPNIKKMTFMLYLYTKMIFQRSIRISFERIKSIKIQKGVQKQICDNIINAAELKEKELIKRWMKHVIQFRQKQNQRKALYKGLAQKMLQVSIEKKRIVIQDWKRLVQQQIKISQLKEVFFQKILHTKVVKLKQGFQLWKLLPRRKNNWNLQKFSKFEKGLVNFIQKTIKKALNSYKKQYEEGIILKRKAAIQLLHKVKESQSRIFNKWKNIALQRRLQDRCQLLAQVFYKAEQTLAHNFSRFLVKKPHNFQATSALYRYFNFLCGNTNKSISKTLQIFNKNTKSHFSNNQIYRCAAILALRSHIDVQRSFWRLRINAEKIQTQNKKTKSDDLFIESNKNKKIQISNVPQRNQAKKSLKMSQDQTITSPHQQKMTGAGIIIQRVRLMWLKRISFCFRSICQHYIKMLNLDQKQRKKQQKGQGMSEKSKLIKQIVEYKKENQILIQQLEERELHLIESNKTVTLLSMKINFIITQQFLNYIQEVIDVNTWKCLNEGFDAIIQKANENFELQQSLKTQMID